MSQTRTASQPSARRGSKNLARNCHIHILQANSRDQEEAGIWPGIVTYTYCRPTLGTTRKQEFGQELSQIHTAGQPSAPTWRKQEFGQELSHTHTAGQPSAPRGSKILARNCHIHIPQVNSRHLEEARIWPGIVTYTYCRPTLGTDLEEARI